MLENKRKRQRPAWLLLGCCSLTPNVMVQTSAAFLLQPTVHPVENLPIIRQTGFRCPVSGVFSQGALLGVAASSELPPSKKNSKRSTKRRNNNNLKGKSNYKNVDDLVSKIGLTPVSTTRERGPNNKPQTNNNNNSDNFLRRPSLQTQLNYSRNGHTALRQHVDPLLLQTIRKELEQHGSKNELLAWRQKVEVAAGNDSTKYDYLANCETIDDCIRELDRLGISWDRLPFLQYFNTWREIPVVKKLAYDLAETAAILLDIPSVRLYQDSFFWKRSQDGPTPWHTDARMAPFDTANMLTFWIPLHDIPRDGSALHFLSKSHADFALPFWNPYEETDDLQSQWNVLEKRYEHHKIAHHMPLSMGDITVHSGWTLHCADSQLTNEGAASEDRLALAISYVDARAHVREKVLSKEDHGDDEDQWSYSDWVKEVPPRQTFDHPLVPIVWSR